MATHWIVGQRDYGCIREKTGERVGDVPFAQGPLACFASGSTSAKSPSKGEI